MMAQCNVVSQKSIRAGRGAFWPPPLDAAAPNKRAD